MDESTWTSAPAVFENAAVGQVRMIGENDPTPAGWHDCDGAECNSFEWPQYVRMAGVTGRTFTVPKPERSLPGRRFIVKLEAS